jgi:two-component system response regulator VanR
MSFSILYVEDEIATQEMLAEVLQTLCDTLYVANDGLQGLKVYEMKKPDLIITDVEMPKLNGIDMISKIRQNDQKTKVIISTAYATDDKYQETFGHIQVDGYINKPLDIEELCNAIDVMKGQLN